MSDFIWGFTTRDIQNALWNGLSENAMLFGGMAVAAVANALAQYIIPNGHQNKACGMKNLACTVIGVGAGVWVSFSYANRLPHITFAADKALKFAVITVVAGAIGLRAGPIGGVIGLITGGGAWGYFGRNVLRFGGAVGAVIGSLAATAYALKKASS